ncbi:transglutaminase family protein [Iodidimonas sp. SYSU 1G8]|uniref:transglutaminase-like domain-containing protein n=1 Tax=Iodidimonas sp. SYSU 1G8 TaxID=3133967 RepID=UPI0031FE9EF5
MQIRVGYELIYHCVQPTPMILTLNIHSSRSGDIITPDRLATDPAVPLQAYRDAFGNWCTRLVAPPGPIRIYADALVKDTGLPDIVAPGTPQTPVEQLPDDALMFLLGSRYCETDRLAGFAWARFGHVEGGWEKVQAVVDFVHNHLRFSYPEARPTRTALDAFTEGKAVCRDFAHLAITLCRCLNIPARYCTGYLGDIGVPPVPDPMDFSAWFEVYLDGKWYTFDARHNTPRIGRILIARGRDASDVAISSSFGPTELLQFKVWTDEVPTD